MFQNLNRTSLVKTHWRNLWERQDGFLKDLLKSYSGFYERIIRDIPELEPIHVTSNRNDCPEGLLQVTHLFPSNQQKLKEKENKEERV